jgi:hypothetical protein
VLPLVPAAMPIQMVNWRLPRQTTPRRGRELPRILTAKSATADTTRRLGDRPSRSVRCHRKAEPHPAGCDPLGPGAAGARSLRRRPVLRSRANAARQHGGRTSCRRIPSRPARWRSCFWTPVADPEDKNESGLTAATHLEQRAWLTSPICCPPPPSLEWLSAGSSGRDPREAGTRR